MMRRRDFPVFDADNHLYETEDAFTRHLPKRYKRAIDYVQVRGRTKIAIRGTISEYIPNPTFDVVARPGAQEEYFRIGNPEGKSYRDIVGDPMKCIPAFREPKARVELMDEQGVDRTLMFPTLASLLEERMRDDPGADPRRDPLAERVAARDVVVQPREPDLHDADHHAADRREGDRGAGVVRRARRQDRAHPSRAGAVLRRLAVVRLSGVRPVLEGRRRLRRPRVDALLGQRLLPLPERLDRPARDAAVPARPVPLADDGQAPDRGHDGGVHLPRRPHALPRPARRRHRERRRLGRVVPRAPRRRPPEDAERSSTRIR